MTHEGRYDNIKALLNVSPPRAVRLDLPLDDNVEQSALRSTCSGSLASAIDLLESKINPLESKIKAGRLLPDAAFAGGDSDLSKLKALQPAGCGHDQDARINQLPTCLLDATFFRLRDVM